MNWNHAEWKVGDWAVYLKQKASTSPGPRARHVSPATAGENYRYIVEKYWIVKEIMAPGELLLITRRGKQHQVSTDDPLLRRPSWWQRLVFKNRFRAVETNFQDEHAVA